MAVAERPKFAAWRPSFNILTNGHWAESIANKTPDWHRELVDAQSFIMLPVVINTKHRPFYADMQLAHSLKLSERQLSLLCTLRNQAVRHQAKDVAAGYGYAPCMAARAGLAAR